MKSSGRTIFIFLILIVIILVSGISISLYLLQKETLARQTAEASLEDLRGKTAKLEGDLKESQKQIQVLKGKNKDADDKINSLIDELEIEKGLREEIKKENQKLKENVESEAKSKLELRQKMSKELDDARTELKALKEKLAGREEKTAEFEARIKELEARNKELEDKLSDMNVKAAEQEFKAQEVQETQVIQAPMDDNVELDKIVVSPDSALQGRVLNVDTETNFLIFDLGSKNGIQEGMLMSIYRGKNYLGDVRVTRVQDELAAADLVPPFSSQKVRKNDQVVPKR